jgi:hypothetical protein
MFTPTTVEKFTGHFRGAIYGDPVKNPEGRTALSNLYLCGTDQGMLGIVGSMLSGISMANQAHPAGRRRRSLAARNQLPTAQALLQHHPPWLMTGSKGSPTSMT